MARDWINTPAADFGPVELAAAARGLAERHRRDPIAEWVGEDLLRGEFSRHSCGGARQRAAPRWSNALVAARGAACRNLTAGRQGRLLRQRRPRHQAGRRHGAHEKGHGRRGGGARARAHAHERGIRAELRVLIPAVENSISGNAYRPGDVLATRKGLSVEVGNTDAEGRLVLCDALALADAEQPDLIIDFATLTGAARVALGPELPALFGTDEQVVGDLARAAAAEHDPLWPMPLWRATTMNSAARSPI
jgi:leucyl aminopeptidase